MTHTDPADVPEYATLGEIELVEDAPAVPARVRTVAYFLGLTTGAAVLAATGIAPIWLEPDIAEQVVSTAGVISGVAAFIAGGLGVTYRPTR